MLFKSNRVIPENQLPLSQREAYTEKELLLQVSKGEEQAFAKLFHLHHQHLAVCIFRLTNSLEMTEEVVQDVFLKIWSNRASLEDVQDFRAWLFTISKNHALNCLRKIVKERVEYKKWLQVQGAGIDEDDAATVGQYELLDQAIGQLPPQQQKVFVLSRIEKLKYEEIAVKMNLSRETVKSYIALARSSITKYVSSRVPVVVVCLVISVLRKIIS